MKKARDHQKRQYIHIGESMNTSQVSKNHNEHFLHQLLTFNL